MERELDFWEPIMNDPDKVASLLEYDDIDSEDIDYYLQDQGSSEDEPYNGYFFKAKSDSACSP